MIYVYAIAEAPVEGDAETVEHGGLAAVCATVDELPPATREGYLEHEAVVESVMAQGPVLPFRFGTTVEARSELREMLEQQAGRFRRLLDDVRGRVELSVRAAQPGASRHASLEDLARASVPTGNGTAYLVDADAVTAFADRVRALQAEHPGADLSCTGPWPPYSFVGGG